MTAGLSWFVTLTKVVRKVWPRSRASWLLPAILIVTGCQQQPAAVNPNDPEIVAAVGAILDKTVAAADRVDAEGTLASSTRDDTFTFITGDRMLKGYDEALRAFRETYAMLEGQTNQIIEKRIRVLSPDVVLVSAVSEGTYTDKAGITSPLVGMGSTVIFVRRNGEWRVIHYHESTVR
jgi:uncharacterized protein (TIGR02246 family)